MNAALQAVHWLLHRRCCKHGVADSRYELIAVAIGTSFKLLQSNPAIQQRQFF